MARRQQAAADPRQSTISVQDLQQLQSRVRQRRPKPKNKRAPNFYQDLVEQYDTSQTPIPRQYAAATKDNLAGIKGKFIRFCDTQLRKHWRNVIQNCSKGITLGFLRYIHDEDRVNKRGAMQQYIAQFKMLYNRENGRYIDTNDRKEALKLINTFGLDPMVKSKPVLGVDNLLLLLNHYWARDTSTFPLEQQRVRFALILLLFSGTGCRPTELVDGRKKRTDEGNSEDNNFEPGIDDDISTTEGNTGSKTEKNDFSNYIGGAHQSVCEEDIKQTNAICYKDVRLLVVRSPENEERDVLAMEITMAHHKGHQKRPKPTIFFFTEIDDPIFCPITHLVALALADEAFKAPNINTPERVFEHKVWGPVLCTPVDWKQEKLKTPIFRQEEGSASGDNDATKTALPYSKFRDNLNRLGRAAGFKETAFWVLM